MPKKPTPDEHELIDINLRDPLVAGVLAWLWPGAGHIYQGRYAKGMLFMVCILGAFLFGLFLGEGKVVYASWKKQDRRWQYICQAGVGLPAMPALVQRYRVNSGSQPFFVTGYRNADSESLMEVLESAPLPGQFVVAEAPMTPPLVSPDDRQQDQLAKWHQELGINFEMGTLYTVIAGLLNVLAIYDAYAGPIQASTEEEDDGKDKGDGSPGKEDGA